MLAGADGSQGAEVGLPRGEVILRWPGPALPEGVVCSLTLP